MQRPQPVELLQQAQNEIDSLRRGSRSLKDSEERLRKLFDKESARAEQLAQELAASRRSAHSASTELERVQREIVGLRQGRDTLSRELEDKAQYVKKLEAKLIGGSQGQYLVEQNTRLRAALEELRRQSEASVRLLLLCHSALVLPIGPAPSLSLHSPSSSSSSLLL